MATRLSTQGEAEGSGERGYKLDKVVAVGINQTHVPVCTLLLPLLSMVLHVCY